MKKRILSLLLVFAIVLSLGIPAYAANDTKYTFDLSSNGENSIMVESGSEITVIYKLTAAEETKTISTQNEIYYDDTFFELVEGSVTKFAGFEGFDAGLHEKLAGAKYIYVSSSGDKYFDSDGSQIASFKLKVTATSGSSTIQNTSVSAKALGDIPYPTESHDLTVTVGTIPVAVDGVSIDETASMNVGDEKTLTATITPDGATNTNVTWESSKESVATVDATGKVTALAEGTATITVTTADGNKTASCAVTVSKKTPVVTGTLTANVTYGDTVSPDAINAAGVTVKDGDDTVEGTWAWKNTVTSYENTAAEAKTLAAVFTPENTEKYNTVDANVSVTVGKATLIPAVASVEDKQYNGDTTGSGSLSLTGAKNNEEPTASGTFTWTAADAGTNTVNVSDITLGEDWQTNYQLSAASLTNQAAGKSISKADQNPNISATATLTRGGNTLDLSALVTNAVGDVTFEIASGDAATLDGATLTSDVTKTGEVKITVKAAGNNNYNEYTGPSAITVTVQDKENAGVTITNAPTSTTYGDDTFTVTATASNAGTNGAWTWTSSDDSILKIVSDENTDTVTVQVVSANTTGATLSAKYESDTTADTETTAAIPVAQKELTITGVAANDRDYAADNTAVELVVSSALLNGVVGEDDVILDMTSAVGSIQTADAGENKAVTVTGAALTGADKDNYTLKQPTGIKVTIGKATPDYEAPTGLTALPGDALADVTLPTGWTWKDEDTTSVGSVGSNSFTAVYTPVDTTNYKTVEETVSVAVAKGTPTVDTAPTATAVTYGDPVNDNVLSGGVVKYGDTEVPGTWAWKDTVTSYGNATNGTPRTLKATFTPTDSDRYESVDADVNVTVNKATPEYEAPTGLTATYGDTLADVDIAANTGWSWMDNTASVGDASTTPATFKAKYTPNDTNNYKIVEDIDVSVTVNKAAQSPSITAAATLTKGGNTLDLSTLVTSGTYYGNLSFEITENNSDAAELEVGSTLTSTENLGTVKIVVMADGDTNHESYTSAIDAIAVTVTDKASKTLSGVTQQGCTYGGTLADPSYTAPVGTTGTTLTYAGTTRSGSAYGPNTNKPVDAGTYTVTVKCETATEIYTSSPVNFTISPKSISGATVTLGTSLEYTGFEQTQTVGKVELGGTDITSSCVVSDNTRTNAGSQSLTVTAKDASNYTGSVQMQFTVAKKAITPTIEVSGTYKFTGSAITPTYTVKDGDAELATTDYSAALSDSTNAGNGKITVTEKAGGNYTFSQTEQTFAIGKADTRTFADQNVSLKYTVTTEQSKSVAGLMPSNAGTLSYTKGSESKTGAVTVSGWDVSDAGLVTFTLTDGEAGNTVTLPVTITSTNYADSTVNVVITLTDKDTPTASASNYTTTYTGSPVNVSAITKTASVPGTWAWKDGTQVTNVADSGVKTLVFTPNDTENYESVEVTVTVTIRKAKPTGTPSYTKITVSGKTLADAALTVGTITPAGTITWDKPATTAVSANTSYAWTFTPTDSANYDTLTGTVTLWTRGGDDVTTYSITGADIKNGKLTINRKIAYEGQTVAITVAADEGYQLNDLTVKDAKGKAVELTKVNDTTYTFKMPASKVTVSASFSSKIGACPQDETCVYAKFTDADTKAWYHDGVHYCVENGYMQGVSAIQFDPAGTTTRAMIVTILWRMEGSPVANYAMSFKDVKANQWYTEAIRWAQSTGVVEGYSDDAFGPEDIITREQLATILYRYAEYKGIDVSARSALAGFEDTSSISGWALDYVKWAVAVGMINGRTDTTIVPKGDATRAEAACMIQRFCENILKR